jgi:hypothetical protein
MLEMPQLTLSFYAYYIPATADDFTSTHHSAARGETKGATEAAKSEKGHL